MPIDYSGDEVADLQAILINCIGPSAAEMVYRYDLGHLQNVLWSLGELREDPQARLNRYIQKCLEAHEAKRTDADRFRDLGVKPEETPIVVTDDMMLKFAQRLNETEQP